MTCRKLLVLFLINFLLFNLISLAHAADSLKTKSDTAKLSFVMQMQAFAKKEAKESLDDFNNDKAVVAQSRVLEEIKKDIQKAKIYLKGGIDTISTKAELQLINRDFKAAGDGVFTDKGTAHTFRNLTATANIINELLSRTLMHKAKLESYRQRLQTFRYDIDSLLSNQAIFKFPSDSAGAKKYLRQLVVVAYEAQPVDTVLKVAEGNVQTILTNVNLTAFKLQSSLEEIELLKRNVDNHLFKRDFVNIWGSEGYVRSFDQILSHSAEKARLTFTFYVENNLGKIAILFILIAISYIYLRSLKSIYIQDQLLNSGFEGQLVLRYPLLSAILITLNLYQFVFITPPFILSVLIWVVSSISLSVLFKNFINRYWMAVWLLMVFLFTIATLDNLLLQASRIERWMMLMVMLFGLTASVAIVWKGNRETLREKWIVYSIGLMGILEAGGIFADIFGRYNLAKSLMISGYLNVVVAILFLWTVRLINEGLFLAYNVYSKQDRKLFYLNFEKVGNKAPVIFYVLLIIGWIVLFGRNFSFFEGSIRPLREFFGSERTIGDYTFTINSLLLFIVIMAVSVIISKIVSFFASDHGPSVDKGKTEGLRKIGSWLLLIRITILSIGLFLAIAAVGIPLDRITIVIGALGVGIGFGLQTLVNNLVSGLIIAFEKPVNVGDTVDIGGQTGTMKSIGFRSSIIATLEGADVVMPNGDLLSAHLTNWSLGGNRKRTSILIGIAYDSDLQLVRQILTELLEGEERITKSPHYTLQYEQFNDSAIDLRIYFWAKQMKESASIKSDLIIAITDAFRKNKIAIPFPQRDIYLHSTGTEK
jgi:small-conductance mechanosensitive channel